ncbi:MAG: sodium:proton antiporter [Anaerolineae bacterium]|nr:sodium:proton antiporter [Anaerolineae bacterium]NUQ02910.1 NADH-quinone oxidoreductase subunit K [Anaerolineae bacterium]
MNAIFAIVTGILFGLGVYLLLRRDLVKTAMGYYVLFTAINLFFLAVGVFNGEVAPYVGEQGQPSDPLVQALLLTAIVISFGTYALLLGMINVASRRFGTIDSDDVDHLRR